MIDPIKVAQQKSKLGDISKAISTTNPSISTAALAQATDNLSIPEKIPTSLEDIGLKTPDLPIIPDPELLKKEALALAQTIRSEAEALLQQRKEEELAKLRDKVEPLSKLLGTTLGLYLKLPIIDPKYLAYLAYMEAKEKLRQLKQLTSKENLKKSKEAYTFPMKPPIKIDITQLPTVQIPKIPEIPNINVPKIG